VYGPRSKNNPAASSVPFTQGIHVLVNGAGGKGHYSGSGFLASGTRPDLFFDDERYFVTRINLIDPAIRGRRPARFRHHGRRCAAVGCCIAREDQAVKSHHA
jgi:hypothetical protein